MKIEPVHTLEDSIARCQLQAQHQRGGGNPAVGLMHLLPERMSNTRSLIPQFRARSDQRLVGLDHLQVAQRPVEPSETELTPPRPKSAVAQLGHGHERHDPGPAAKEGANVLRLGQGARIK